MHESEMLYFQIMAVNSVEDMIRKKEKEKRNTKKSSCLNWKIKVKGM